jgi:4-hydroxybenzoate polyprenyltransferase
MRHPDVYTSRQVVDEGIEARRAEVAPWEALRGRQWAHFLALPLAGLEAGASWSRLAGGVAMAALCLGYSYGLNAISDRATDLEVRKNPLAGRALSPRLFAKIAALVAACATAALGLALGSGQVALCAVAASLVASTGYSVGPRWKSVPALGTMLNAAIFAPLLLVASGGAGLPRAFGLELGTFCALLLQNQLLHEQADAAEDTSAGALTTARAIGPRWTATLAIGLALACVAIDWRLAPTVACAIAAVVALGAGTLVSLAGPREPGARRFAHRAVAFAGGAILFVVGRLA